MALHAGIRDMIVLLVAMGLLSPHAVRGDDNTVNLSPLAIQQRWDRAAFAYADIVAIVQIQSTRDDGVVQAVVKRELRGYKTPKTMMLWGIEKTDALMPQSRWLVATNKHHGATADGYVLAMLPDNDRNRANVQRFAQPGWRVTPIVLVVRIAEMIDFTGPKRDPVFEVVKVLRGEMKHRQVMDNGGGKFAKFQPFAAGEQLYVMAVWSVSEGKQLPRPFVYVHSLTAIEKEQIEAIERQLKKDPHRGKHRLIQQTQQRLGELQTAWRFHRAPLVAEVAVSAVAGEVSGLGGTHFLMAPKVWRRGRVDEKKLARGFRSRFPLIPSQFKLPKEGKIAEPGYLFYGGGHGYFGKEKPGEAFLAAGKKVGAGTLARLPANEENLRKVKQWLADATPRFACRKYEEKVFTDKTTAPPKKLAEYSALFEPYLSLEAGLSRHDPAWVRFEVVKRRSVKLPQGKNYVWLHCRLAMKHWPGDAAAGHDHQKNSNSTEWVFTGVDLPDWPAGSRWWGYAIDDGSLVGSQSKLFIPSLFLPAKSKDQQRLRQLLGAVNKFKLMHEHYQRDIERKRAKAAAGAK